MSGVDIADLVGVLPEPAIVVTPSGRILAGNDAYRAIIRERGGDVDAEHLEDVVVDEPQEVKSYLRACAQTRPFVYGSLTLRDGTRADEYRCEGGVLRPATGDSEALLLVRFQRASDAVQRFTLLNKKIEELNAENHRRREAEDELRAIHKTLEQRVEERTADLRRANDELRRSNRALEEFAYVASHDLREPLRKITVFSEMLQEEAGDHLSEHETSILQRMYGAADRMEALIQGLLDYARISTQGNPFEEVDLDDVVDDVLQDLEIAIARSDAEIERDDLPVVMADDVQMRQLFQNLISNSLKFRRKDVAPVIRLSSTSIDEEAHRIEIEDNGIGFDPEYAESIFNPFYRLNPRERFEGTGIGLAICKKIVDRHGGVIRAEARPEDGARFVIRLPRDPLTPSERGAAS